jgi:transposase
MPVQVVVTTATRADCQEAPELIQDLPAQCLIADRGYDSDAVVAFAQRLGMEVVIPPRKHRKHPRTYDRYLYSLRHLVENTFLLLKQWRAQ